MTQKKKILIISISVSLAVALAVIFITLAFTIWKPKIKTTQEWLNDFKTCLVVEKDNSEQKTQKSITILELALNGQKRWAVFSSYKDNEKCRNLSKDKVRHFL